MASKRFVPKEGELVRFLAMSFCDHWEFGQPVVLLYPVRRYFENCDHADVAISNAIDDVACDDCLVDQSDDVAFQHRGWSFAYLTRVAEQCLLGKDFPKRNYHAVEEWYRFHHNGEFWESEQVNTGVSDA